MGACCSGKGHSKLDKHSKKRENKEVVNSLKLSCSTSNFIFNNNEKLNSETPKPLFQLDFDYSQKSKSLTYIVRKFLFNDKERKRINLTQIRKLNIEELWNIARYYEFDHTNSNHIIYDFRVYSNKKENFLKLFRTINYKTEHFQTLDDNIYLRFHKFINGKIIIIIVDEDNIFQAEIFINFIYELKIKVKILLFDNDYNVSILDNGINYLKTIKNIIDFPNFFNLPFIFLTLRYFPHLKNDSVIFLDILKQSNCDKIKIFDKAQSDNNKPSKSKKSISAGLKVGSEHDIFDIIYSENGLYADKALQFFEAFQIGVCLQINLDNQNNECKTENSYNVYEKNLKVRWKGSKTKVKNKTSDKNKDKNSSSKEYDYNVKYFNINNLENLEDLILKKNIINEFLDFLKLEIFSNKSFVIQIPDNFNSKLLIAILCLIIWKLTNLKPILIKNYIIHNFENYFKNLNSNYESNKHVFLNIINNDEFTQISDYLSENFEIPQVSQDDIQFGFNDYLLIQEKLTSGKNNNSTKPLKEHILLSEKKRLQSLRNINAQNVNDNYFSLPSSKNQSVNILEESNNKASNDEIKVTVFSSFFLIHLINLKFISL